jgi:hypothetical protein
MTSSSTVRPPRRQERPASRKTKSAPNLQQKSPISKIVAFLSGNDEGLKRPRLWQARKYPDEE